MTTLKIKTARNFTFKAYAVEKNEEIKIDETVGKFLIKSDCHYYCEKETLDYIRASFNEVKETEQRFVIYKVCTEEQTDKKPQLVETIFVADNIINII